MWCLEKVSVLFAALISVRMVTCLKQVDNTRLTCFSPVNLTAEIRTVYDDNVYDENLYVRKTNESLPGCSSCFSSSSSSSCCACINGELTNLVCFNLTDDVKLMVETRSGNVHFNKTDCPTPPPAVDQRERLGPAGTSGLLILLTSIGSIVVVIIVIVCVLYRCGRSLYRLKTLKICRSHKEQESTSCISSV